MGTGPECKKVLGRISVELSWIEEGLLDAANDWNEFHPVALRELIEEIENGRPD